MGNTSKCLGNGFGGQFSTGHVREAREAHRQRRLFHCVLVRSQTKPHQETSDQDAKISHQQRHAIQNREATCSQKNRQRVRGFTFQNKH